MVWWIAAPIIAYVLCVGAARVVGVAWLYAFVENCTHTLASQTVPLPQLPEMMRD